MSSKPMRKIANKELRPHARGRKWTDVTDGDMRAFALILISKLVKVLLTLFGLLARWLACDGRYRQYFCIWANQPITACTNFSLSSLTSIPPGRLLITHTVKSV